MERKDDNKTRSFIRERIVPKKKTKRILFTVLGVIAAAVVFGVVAGVAFRLSRDLFGREASPTESQIIILPRGEQEPSAGGDILTPTEETETEEAEPSSASVEETGESASAALPETKPAPVTLDGIFKGVEKGIAPVTLVQPAAEDWFNEPQTNRIELFGAFIAEDSESVFLMTDGRNYTEGSLYHVTIGREVLVMEPYGVDEITGLAVLKIGKDHLKRSIQILSLGSSAYLSRGTRVFLIGSLYGRYVAADEGRLTFINSEEALIDGYQQLLYTNMMRVPGSLGILVNEYGDVVGWMSDGSAGTGQTAVAQGVSSLKFIMNKLVRGETAPYLGMLCRTVTTDDVLGTDRKAGLYVKNVEVDSPAFYAGVQAGDRIISIGQRSVLSNRGLQELFETLSPEQTIGISVGRLNNGEEEIINLSAELGERSQ